MAVNKKRKDLEKLKFRALAEKETRKREDEAREKAFLLMLAVPLNVLLHDYWGEEKSKELAPEFIEKCFGLYEAVQDGVVGYDDMAELIFDYAGVQIDAKWLTKDAN